MGSSNATYGSPKPRRGFNQRPHQSPEHRQGLNQHSPSFTKGSSGSCAALQVTSLPRSSVGSSLPSSSVGSSFLSFSVDSNLQTSSVGSSLQSSPVASSRASPAPLWVQVSISSSMICHQPPRLLLSHRAPDILGTCSFVTALRGSFSAGPQVFNIIASPKVLATTVTGCQDLNPSGLLKYVSPRDDLPEVLPNCVPPRNNFTAIFLSFMPHRNDLPAIRLNSVLPA
ncbi:hypothetical protein CRENBAI_021652 [Crenichthys baileyi]|uniref:Uncharacterized protein n=1 Tax=Crenichthys baileyi TaxID=28760 RepID=A0AAV9RIF3_9TELE